MGFGLTASVNKLRFPKEGEIIEQWWCGEWKKTRVKQNGVNEAGGQFSTELGLCFIDRKDKDWRWIVLENQPNEVKRIEQLNREILDRNDIIEDLSKRLILERSSKEFYQDCFAVSGDSNKRLIEEKEELEATLEDVSVAKEVVEERLRTAKEALKANKGLEHLIHSITPVSIKLYHKGLYPHLPIEIVVTATGFCSGISQRFNKDNLLHASLDFTCHDISVCSKRCNA